MQITHTSSHAKGQIYLPVINWLLAFMVALLVVSFRSSASMLPAYGLAVVGTMLITTLMQYVVVFRIWRSPLWQGGAGIVLFITVDLIFLASGLTKLFEGAWFPIMVGLIIFTLLSTWAAGRKIMRERLEEGSIPLSVFIASTARSIHRVRGTSVFLSASATAIPPALLHNLKHNQVLHQRVILLTVQVEDVPQVEETERATVSDEGHGFYRVILHYGFMEQVDIPQDLAAIAAFGTHDDDQLLPRAADAYRIEGESGHGTVARATFRLDVDEFGKRDGILQAAEQPGGGTGQPVADIGRSHRDGGPNQNGPPQRGRPSSGTR